MAENTNYVVDNGQNLIEALNKNETESAISEAIESAVSEINAKFADYYNKTEIDAALANYYSKTEIDAAFENYYTKTQINTTFSNYYSKTEVDAAFENYYTKTQIDAFNLATNNAIEALRGVWLTQTLTAGTTTVVFSDSSITTDSMLRVFSSVYGVNPINISVANGSVTMTFIQQSTDVSIVLNVFEVV